jgi:tetraacyldisaccharide 4'-kinase
MKNLILKILSALYDVATSLRNALFDCGVFKPYRSLIRVVSIGNLTAGGNGKTMLVMALCKQAVACGYKPVVLSRGYGGSETGPYLVSSDDRVSQVGDEPLLMAHYALRNATSPQWRVVVSRNRVLGAKFIEERELGDLIILDDGFQHRWLARDIDLVAVNISGNSAVSDFLKGVLLPLGFFRENKVRALRRATHVVLVSRSPDDNQKDVTLIQNSLPSHLVAGRASFGVIAVEDNEGASLPPNAEVNVFCALGNPQGFLLTVSSLGFLVHETLTLGDHQAVTASQLKKLQTLPVVCSEKDYIKIPKELQHGVFVVKVGVEIEQSILSDLLPRYN